MLRYLRTILLLAILYSTGCISHNEPKQYPDYSTSSDFQIGKVDEQVIENFEVLGKVWGYVKYHHPVFGTTRYDADYELFELLPVIAEAEKDERNKILLEWIEDLGEFKLSEKKYRRLESGEDFIMLADLQWIHDTELLGEELSGKLTQLRYAKRKSNRYVRPSPAGHPLFDGENEYEHIRWPDKGYQLLSLFRFWNMIEYYFPYRDITDNDWSGILRKYIAEVLTPEAEEHRLIAAKYIAELNDTHAVLERADFIFGDRLALLDLGFVEDKLVILSDRYSNLSDIGLTVGTEIADIDGRPVNDIKNKVARYISYSNEGGLLWLSSHFALQTVNTHLLLSIRSNEQIKNVMVPAVTAGEYYAAHTNSQKEYLEQKTYRMLVDDTIGYIYAGNYQTKDADSLMTVYADTKALIIDLRCYPSEVMLYDFIGRHFFDTETEFLCTLRQNITLPGTYNTKLHSLGRENPNNYKGPIIVLVNEFTLSQSEEAVMAFQATNNCTVIGSQTAGADGNISYIPLPARISAHPSFIGMFYPDGTPTQRVGVKIDHYVEPSIQGIKEGRDEVLEYAIKLINNTNS